MKYLISIIFLFIITHAGLIAQEYIPFLEGKPKWHVYVDQTDYSWEEPTYPEGKTLRRYYLEGDSIINGLAYRKLIEDIGDTAAPKSYFKGLIREEDKGIYYIGDDYGGYNYGGKELLLYDFNSDIGDTVYHDFIDERSPYTIIKNIDSVKIAGEYRKRYKLEMNSLLPFENEEYWIEGVGNVKNGILGAITLITEPGYMINWELVCYKKDGKDVYKNPSFNNCYPEDSILSTNTNVIHNFEIFIYPNPLEDKLYINNILEKGIVLTITNITGRIIFQKELSQSENVITIPKHHGFLIINLSNTQGKLIKKKKVIQK